MLFRSYLPLTLDEPDQCASVPIFYGGLSVYLAQQSALFRRLPGWLRRFMAARPLLKFAGARAAKTRAVEQPDGTWVLDGEKTFITNGGLAELFTVYAKVGEQDAALIVSEFRRVFPRQVLTATSFQSTEDDLDEDFGRAENYLSLVGFVIVVLGGLVGYGERLRLAQVAGLGALAVGLVLATLPA